MSRPLSLLFAVALLALPDLAAAAPQGDDPRPRVAQAGDGEAAPARPGARKKRKRVMERIRALRAWKLTEVLELDEPTASKLFPILRTYDTQLAPLMAESRKLRKRIRALSEQGGAGDARTANGLLDLLVANQRRIWDVQEARFKALRAVLTPRQAARLFVVLPDLDRKIQRQVRRAMRGQRRGKQRGAKDAAPGAKPNRRGKRSKRGKRGKRDKRDKRDKANDGDVIQDPFQ